MTVMTPSRRAQRGFSLLETLVAFTILALSLGILLRIFGGGAFMTRKAEEHARAVWLAESLLAEKACEACKLPMGGISGEFGELYRWSLQTAPYVMNDGGDTKSGQGVSQADPVWVEATVEWGEGDDAQQFTLSTLRLQAKSDGLSAGMGGVD